MRLNEAKVILEENGYELLESGDFGDVAITVFGLGTLVFWLKYFAGFLSPVSIIKSCLYIKKLLNNIEKDPETFAENIAKDLQLSRFVHRNINDLKDYEIKEVLVVYFDHICNKTRAKIKDSTEFKPLYWSILKLYYRLIVGYLDKESKQELIEAINPIIKTIRKENNVFYRTVEALADATGLFTDTENNKYKNRNEYMNYNEKRFKKELSKMTDDELWDLKMCKTDTRVR